LGNQRRIFQACNVSSSQIWLSWSIYSNKTTKISYSSRYLHQTGLSRTFVHRGSLRNKAKLWTSSCRLKARLASRPKTTLSVQSAWLI
jgi:hypothetical protein